MNDLVKAPMTREAYNDLMSQGLWETIDQSTHDRFYNDWYEKYFGVSLNSLNPIINRNNIPGEFNTRKTSGRLATNEFKAFKLKQKKRILNKKSSRNRRQGRQTQKRRFNLNYSNYNNNSENELYNDFIKLWAVNCLVVSISKSNSLDEFETYLDIPISEGSKSQNPEMIEYQIKNNIKIPDNILRNYFESRNYINKSSLDTFHKLVVDELYNDQHSTYVFSRNYEDYKIPLIDAKSTSIYTVLYEGFNNYNSSYMRFIHFLDPLMTALYKKNNADIINKIISFNPSFEETLTEIYNNPQLSISFESVVLLITKLGATGDKIISNIAKAQANEHYSYLDVALLYNNNYLNKIKPNINKVFENLLSGQILSVDQVKIVLDYLKSKDLKPSKQLIVDTINTLLKRISNTDDREDKYKFLEYVVNMIDPNISIDRDGNTVLMRLLRSVSDNSDSITRIINMMLSNPQFDPNHRNELGETALAVAIKMGKKDIANRLMKDPRTNLEAKNIYGSKIINTLRTSMATAAGPAVVSTPQENNFTWNEWANNEGPSRTGRGTRRNNYRNMMRTYERAIKPRIAMTMSAKKVGRRQAQLGPNLGRHIASFVPSAVGTNE